MSDTRPTQTVARPRPDAGGTSLPEEVLLGRYRVLSRRGKGGFGTVCASLLALAHDGTPTWRFCPGRPGAAPFEPVRLPEHAPA